MRAFFISFGAVLVIGLVLCGAAAAQIEKDEVPVEGGAADKAGSQEAKRPGVFELVNRMLEVRVNVKGKKMSPEVSADIASKVEGALKDCFVQQIKANEKYRVRDDKLYKARYSLSVKMDRGLFKGVSVDSSSGSSPVMKACVKPLIGLETGYGDQAGNISITIDTRLK
jgi:hypothetical protein